ncbi:MAG TPA: hypothetical protein VFS43_36355 [Polyangiaceae bacterium]|nr:hypothetical protein [Polyangiaceae bacterium]
MEAMPDDGHLRGAPKTARTSPFGKTTERIQRSGPLVPPRSGPPSSQRLPAAPSALQPAGTPMYDAVAGEQALLLLMPRLNTLSADRLERPRVDLENAAVGAIELARLVREPTLRARFRALPPSEFDPEWLDLLEPLAWALWHVHRADRAANAAVASAVVPVDLSEAAVELERRMQTCVEYHLSDHPDAGPKVAFLRVGTGYRDLAGDLMGYAELYRDYRDELCHDRKNYREGDADEAVLLATRLFEALALGQGGDQHRLALRDRTWTLLARCYEEIAATGRWLLRHDPNVSSFFPPLHALGRSGGVRKVIRPSNALGLPPPPASL